MNRIGYKSHNFKEFEIRFYLPLVGDKMYRYANMLYKASVISYFKKLVYHSHVNFAVDQERCLKALFISLFRTQKNGKE